MMTEQTLSAALLDWSACVAAKFDREREMRFGERGRADSDKFRAVQGFEYPFRIRLPADCGNHSRRIKNHRNSP